MPKFLTDEEMAALESGEPAKPRVISDEEMATLESGGQKSEFTPEPGATRITPRKYTGPVEYGPLSQIAASIPLAGSGAKFVSNKLRSAFDREDGESFDQASERHNKKFMDDRRTFEESAPGVTMATGIAGGFALPAAKAAGALGKWIGVPAYNAAEGAVDNLLMSEDTEEAQEAGLLSGAITTGMNALGKVGRLGGAALRRFGLGVKGDVAEHYLKNSQRVNDLDFAKMEKDFLGRRADAEAAERLAKEQLGSAAEAYDFAALRAKDNLKATRDFKTDETVRNVTGALDDSFPEVKKQLSAGSKAAEDALRKDVQAIPWDNYIDDVEAAIAYRKKRASVTDSDATVQALRDIQGRLTRARDSGGGAFEAKGLLEDLGRTGFKGPQAPGEFSPPDLGAIRSVREGINTDLRGKSSEFARIMDEQSHRRRLMKAASKLAGNPEQVANKVKGLDSPLKGNIREVLDEYGRVAGRDFLSPLKPALEADALLKSGEGLERHLRSLPEYLKRTEAEKALERASSESGIFKGNLRTQVNRLAKTPDDQVATEWLEGVGKRMGFNPSELAMDVRTQRRLTNVGDGQGLIPRNAVQAAGHAVQQSRNYGGPFYKGLVDRTLLNDNYMKVYGASQALRGRLPRTVTGLVSRDPGSTEEEYEDFVRRRGN